MEGGDRAARAVMLAAVFATGVAAPVAAQEPQPDSVERAPAIQRVTVTFTGAPIRDVLRTFAAFSGKSIVASPQLSATVTASIQDEPWDVALGTILRAYAMVATENEYGIISVGRLEDLQPDEAVAPLLTRAYRVSYAPVAEMQVVLQPLLSDRGSLSIIQSNSTVVVTDVARVHRLIAGLVRTP